MQNKQKAELCKTSKKHLKISDKYGIMEMVFELIAYKKLKKLTKTVKDVDRYVRKQKDSGIIFRSTKI